MASKKKRGGCVSGGIEVAEDIAVVVPGVKELPSKRKKREKKHEMRNGEDDWAVVTPGDI
jgi:hypothetical protein